jgi:hypothetical protein
MIVIAEGLFAGIVQDSLTVSGNAATTAAAIAGHDSLWRWGIAVHLIYLATMTTMMNVAGVCYFVSSLSNVVAPGLAHLLSPWIIVPCFLGEASLAIWLLFKGTQST